MSEIIIGKIKEHDIIMVSSLLVGVREYPVTRIIGNKAITKFRIFNTKIYPGGYVYEYGKHRTTNSYWVKGKRNG